MTTQAFSGARIRAARHAAGLTQAALAHAINTRERNIIRWENDQHDPRFEHVAAIAKVTGKPLDFFTAQEEEASEDDSEAAEPMFADLSRDEYALYGALTARIIGGRSVREARLSVERS